MGRFWPTPVPQSPDIEKSLWFSIRLRKSLIFLSLKDFDLRETPSRVPIYTKHQLIYISESEQKLNDHSHFTKAAENYTTPIPKSATRGLKSFKGYL